MAMEQRVTITVETVDPQHAANGTTLRSLAELDDWLGENASLEIDNILYTAPGGSLQAAYYQFEAPSPTEMWVGGDDGLVIVARGPESRQSLDAALKLYVRLMHGASITASAMGHTRDYTFGTLHALDSWLQDVGRGYVLTSIVYRHGVTLESAFQHTIKDDGGLNAMVIVQDGILRVYGYGEKAREGVAAALAWFDLLTDTGTAPGDEPADSCE